MGVFSWTLADTGGSIWITGTAGGPTPCWMLDPGGAHRYEAWYRGDGVFGGVDAFAHWMRINRLVPGDAGDGEARAAFFSDPRHWAAYEAAQEGDPGWLPLKFASRDIPYSAVGPSADCPHQGIPPCGEETDRRAAGPAPGR